MPKTPKERIDAIRAAYLEKKADGAWRYSWEEIRANFKAGAPTVANAVRDLPPRGGQAKKKHLKPATIKAAWLRKRLDERQLERVNAALAKTQPPRWGNIREVIAAIVRYDPSITKIEIVGDEARITRAVVDNYNFGGAK